MSQYSMLVRDLFGEAKVVIGQLEPDGGDGTSNYGIALVNPAGELVKLHDFIFGPVVSKVDGFILVHDNINWTGSTPASGIVTIGDTGRCMVTVSCEMDLSTASPPPGFIGGLMSYRYWHWNGSDWDLVEDGDADRSFSQVFSNSSGGFSLISRGSFVNFHDDLEPGDYIFEACYQTSDTLTGASFSVRRLIVQPY